jgi:predicted phosphodiesterase
MSEFSERVERLLDTVEAGGLDTSVPIAKGSGLQGSPWIAGVTFDGREGEITTKPRNAPVGDWDAELKSWGFDPALFEVVEPIRFSTWQTYDERQLWAYKAVIKTKSGLNRDDLEALTAPVRRDKRKPVKRPEGEYTLVLPIGDWQIGKSDGDGLRGSVARIEASFDSVLDRVAMLRKSGYKIGGLVVCSLGDLGEGCDGFYAQQTFNVELDRRDQNKVVRRLARNGLMKLAPEFERVTVAAVAGNHGENRRGGKSFTSNNDNDDVAIWESVAETLSVNPDLYGHINWLIPRGELSVSVQVGEQVLGLAHGHQARGGDVGKWWASQTLAGLNTASANIMLYGHWHHFKMVEVAKGKWTLGIPAQDGGSDWFSETNSNSSTGQVSFLLSESGWTELAIV